MADIYAYQSVMEEVRSKGQGQIGRYMSSNLGIKNTIEKQLGNVQSSYNALLNTALQIKQRLNESLVKFQEYETTIESILQCLKEWEQYVSQQMDAPVASVDDARLQLDDVKNTLAKMQVEKTKLALAVQSCEAAAACISRPNTPQDPIPYRVPETELAVRSKLEDFLDQVAKMMQRFRFLYLLVDLN